MSSGMVCFLSSFQLAFFSANWGACHFSNKPARSGKMPMLPIPASRWERPCGYPRARPSLVATSKMRLIRRDPAREAGAIAAMVASGESEIVEICIVAGGSEPISPCGGCRQKISEFSKPDTPVILANPNGDSVRKTAGELLPDSFKPSHLEA